MDTFLAITSRREARRYADRPIPAEITQRVLDAGRLAGSAQNRQPWRFLLVESPDVKERLAESVYEPTNILGAKLIVAIVGRSGFDTGRCAQNMMLAAWNDEVGSCPNGLRNTDAAHKALGLDPDEDIAIVLTFGYPARERDPLHNTAEKWSDRANRKPLDELVERR